MIEANKISATEKVGLIAKLTSVDLIIEFRKRFRNTVLEEIELEMLAEKLPLNILKNELERRKQLKLFSTEKIV